MSENMNEVRKRGAQQEDKASKIDENLSPLERVKSYSASEHVAQKLYLVRDLMNHAQQIGYADSCEHIIAGLQTLMYDSEPSIRESIADVIPSFCAFLQQTSPNKEATDQVIFEKIIPILTELLKDKQTSVRDIASNATVTLAQSLSKDKANEYIIPALTNLIQDANEEEFRAIGTSLFNKLAPLMGEEYVLTKVIPVAEKFSDEAYFRVRVAFVSTIQHLCHVLDVQKVTEYVLPVYLELSKDEIWSVRKACAENLVEVSKHILPERRLTDLVPIFDSWANDNTRWVRASAYDALGPFIVTFEKSEVPSTLLNHFCDLAKENAKHTFCDCDYVVYCAFNFPAVLHTIGRDRWSELSATYFALVNDLQWKVRRTLACSLHIVADILGQKLAEELLIPIFEQYLKDLDEVKAGVVKYLAKFLKVLSPETRRRYFYIMDEIQHSAVNWRFRKLIAKQIGELAKLFDADTVYTEIVPFGAALMVDPVAQVRRAVQKELPIIVVALQSIPEKKKQFVSQIRQLATHESFQYRLMFIKICSSSVKYLDKEQFEEHFLKALLQLYKDKIPNIRVVAAAALKEITQHDAYKNDTRILKALNELQADKDQDVVLNSGGVPRPRQSQKQKN